MGKGYGFKCEKCKNEYSVYLGVGMRYPSECRELLCDIAEGVYGAEFQEVVNTQKYVAADAQKNLYVCKHCGGWAVEPALDLYVPKDLEKMLCKQYGIKTVAEWGYIPYIMPYEMKKEYTLLKRFIHRCPDCGKRTHKVDEQKLWELSCPKCKTKNEKAEFLLWD